MTGPLFWAGTPRQLLTPDEPVCDLTTAGWVRPVLLGAWCDGHHVQVADEQGGLQLRAAAPPGDEVGVAALAQLLNLQALPDLRSNGEARQLRRCR